MLEYEKEILEICKRHGVTKQEMLSETYRICFQHARAEVYMMLRNRGWSLPRIGKLFNRHHTSIMHAINNYSPLSEWERATQLLAEKFVKDVFKSGKPEWICGCIGGIFQARDYYFSLDMVVDYYRYNATPEQVIEYYDKAYELSKEDKNPPVNFENFIKYGWDIK